MSQKTEIVITARDETRAAIASAQRGLQGLSASAASLKNSFSFLGGVGGLAGLLGGATLVSTVKTAIDSLDALNESAERLGISVEDLSALNFAGKLNGVAADEMAEALKKLSVKMKDAADGGKEAGALFEALGVKVTDSSGRLKSADAVFGEIAESFSGMEDGAGKTAIAVESFGKSGAKMVPILNGGAAGLKTMREEAEKLGAIMDGKLAKQADEFNDNLERLKTVSAAAGIAIASDLLPWLSKLSEEFLAGVKNSDGFLNALNAFGTLNPFKGTSENLATVRGDLAKMEADLKEYGYLDEARFNRKKTQLAYLKDLQLKEALAGSEGNYGNEGRGFSASTIKRAAPSLAVADDKPKRGGGGGSARAQADDAARLLASLREQVALKEVDLQGTEKMTNAEKEAAKVKYQLESGTLKATDAQRASIFAALESLSVLEKSLAAQEDYRKALESQEATNVKNNQAMTEQVAAVEQANALYGLSASQITAVSIAHLEDARALAESNGAYPEHLAFLDAETEKLRALGAAQEDGDLQALLANTKSAQEAASAAKVATLDRALSSGKIDEKQYQEAIDGLKGEVGELGEVAKQAARNAQDAMADFFINPTKDGIKGMATTFSETTQKMIAQAGSAQLFKLLLGDKFDKTGEMGGWLGDLLKGIKGVSTGKAGAATGSAVAGAGAAGLMPGEWDWLDDQMGQFKIDIGHVFGSMSGTFESVATGLDDILGSLLDSFSSMGFGGTGGGSSVDWVSLVGSVAGAFGFANGGIMTSAGAVPLRKYATGGIASSPQLAIFGEGSTPEAYVPLPDGRRIPVAMSGAGRAVNQVMNFYGAAEPAQVKRAAAAGARQVTGLSAASARYA